MIFITTDSILNAIKEIACEVKVNEPMTAHTSFKIGGAADYLVSVMNIDQLIDLNKYVKENNLTLRIIGNGSNLLISDSGLRGIVAKLEGEFSELVVSSEELGVKERNEKLLTTHYSLLTGAGVPLTSACKFALQHSLAGMEFAYGIPGTVGGAVFMNAGAYGGEMKNIVTSVECFSRNDNQIITLSNEECEFEYRHSRFMQGDLIILKAYINLNPAKSDEIRAKMEVFYGQRRDKQPLEYPSAGSVFKRPPGLFAGTLIEQSGLKGAQIGGAQVSEKHAGFIVNKGGATCKDVLDLVSHVQKVVKDKFDVELECEIKISEG